MKDTLGVRSYIKMAKRKSILKKYWWIWLLLLLAVGVGLMYFFKFNVLQEVFPDPSALGGGHGSGQGGGSIG